MSIHGDEAYNNFMKGYNCAQSVALAYAEEMHLTPEQALTMSAGFGGGVGRLREVCGAFSGIVLVLGALYGSPDPSQKTALYTEVQALAERYRTENGGGSIVCRELLGLDNAELVFTDAALHAIAKKTIERKSGARGLRSVVEELLIPIMYDIPSDPTIIRVTIDEDTVNGGKPQLDYGAVRKRFCIPAKEEESCPIFAWLCCSFTPETHGRKRRKLVWMPAIVPNPWGRTWLCFRKCGAQDIRFRRRKHCSGQALCRSGIPFWGLLPPAPGSWRWP